MLQQLLEQRELLGNVVQHLHVIRDIELVSQELSNLQVSLESSFILTTLHLHVTI